MVRSCLVFAIFVQVVFGQYRPPRMGMNLPREPKDFGLHHPYRAMIPRHCWGPPAGIDVHDCCPVPRFYPDEILDACEIPHHHPNDPAIPESKRRPPCIDSLCLMNKTNLLMPNGAINYAKMRTYLDQWILSHPLYANAMTEAKLECAKDGGPKGPPVCEPDRIYYCVTSKIIWNCPKFKPTEDCTRLKEHMDECRPYYINPKGARERPL